MLNVFVRVLAEVVSKGREVVFFRGEEQKDVEKWHVFKFDIDIRGIFFGGIIPKDKRVLRGEEFGPDIPCGQFFMTLQVAVILFNLRNLARFIQMRFIHGLGLVFGKG